MFKKLLFIAGMTVAIPLMANSGNTDTATLLERLKSLYPATTFTAVRPSQIEGLYEVIMGRNVIYTNKDGKYFMFGHLFDMQKQTDVTAELMETLSRIDISRLPLDDAFITVHGTGERHLYLFSDPDCPYCKRLEKALKQLDNVTIHTFLFPIAELHPRAPDKTRGVWCAKDQNVAWRALMNEGTQPDSNTGDCANPIDRNVRLAASLGIEGTPAMIFENGLLVQGYKSAPELEKLLKGGKN